MKRCAKCRKELPLTKFLVNDVGEDKSRLVPYCGRCYEIKIDVGRYTYASYKIGKAMRRKFGNIELC